MFKALSFAAISALMFAGNASANSNSHLTGDYLSDLAHDALDFVKQIDTVVIKAHLPSELEEADLLHNDLIAISLDVIRLSDIKEFGNSDIDGDSGNNKYSDDDDEFCDDDGNCGDDDDECKDGHCSDDDDECQNGHCSDGDCDDQDRDEENEEDKLDFSAGNADSGDYANDGFLV